jgi:3-deoxy-7-phosphoheptulonate synthase
MSDTNGIHNTRISHITPLPTPAELKAQFPLTSKGRETVLGSRSSIEKILFGEDSRLLVVVGPCSVHRMDEVFDYATRLAQLAINYNDQMHIVMRFCGDKPRTGRAWTGWWNDPRMDGSCDIAGGWREGRETMVKILDMGLPLGCEVLDAEHFQRVDDLPSYVWIGARNVGGQRERQIASRGIQESR